jgi:D-xylose transport system substrate-binding protein
MWKKFFSVLFCFTLFFVRESFSQNLKVAFILATEKEQRYKKDKSYFLDEAKKLGLDVFFASADNSVDLQRKLIRRAVDEEKVSVLVIQPVDSSSISQEIEYAKSKGVKILAYDRIIYDASVDFYVSHDSKLVGIIQAKEAVKFTDGKGKYVILAGGRNHSVAKQITSGNLLILDKYPGMKLVGIFYHENWDESESYRTMKEILKKVRDINVVLANNSSLIRGAIKALAEEGIKGVFTAGADADLENCRMIVRGEQNLDVLKPIEPLARSAARIAYALATGKTPNYSEKLNNGKVEVKVILIPVEPVTISNIDEVIIKSGFHSREAIYGQ